MIRTTLAVFAALLSWVLAASLVDLLLRHGIAGYAAAEPTFAFTLGMQLARLGLAAVAGLAGGAVAGWIAPGDARAPGIAGVILLVYFLPTHARLWHTFPVWYHLAFLLTLVPLLLLGARWLGARRAALPPPAASV